MSEYPIRIEDTHYKHSGGTKFYNISVIHNAEGKSVVVYRFGRVSQFGQIQVFEFGDLASARKAADKKERSKTGSSGYRQDGPTSETVVSSSKTLPAQMGVGLFNKIGKSAINHLDPGFDTSKMREIDPPTLNEDGTRALDVRRKVDLSKEIEEMRQKERLEVERAYDDNPQFGMF